MELVSEMEMLQSSLELAKAELDKREMSAQTRYAFQYLFNQASIVAHTVAKGMKMQNVRDHLDHGKYHSLREAIPDDAQERNHKQMMAVPSVIEWLNKNGNPKEVYRALTKLAKVGGIHEIRRGSRVWWARRLPGEVIPSEVGQDNTSTQPGQEVIAPLH